MKQGSHIRKNDLLEVWVFNDPRKSEINRILNQIMVFGLKLFSNFGKKTNQTNEI